MTTLRDFDEAPVCEEPSLLHVGIPLSQSDGYVDLLIMVPSQNSICASSSHDVEVAMLPLQLYA